MDKRETEEEAEEMEDRDRGMGSIKSRCDVMYGRRQGTKGNVSFRNRERGAVLSPTGKGLMPPGVSHIKNIYAQFVPRSSSFICSK